jgi:uncharacterized membrane protein YeiB
MLGLALIIWFASCIFVAACERLLGAGPLEHLLRLVTGPRPPARPVPPALPSS